MQKDSKIFFISSSDYVKTPEVPLLSARAVFLCAEKRYL
nr:MAG TPA: hypothetical protein [Caudoviricetes sp.]DAN52714.1 MAG TPA: hypothetical protein [Caudoviricetes sp.]DAW49975.1 MAG TPA: hypothetical protein [Caudoviricetes sp.]DAW94603.1 MAG TPA: hypothetical protein [Bacteriophage sp.]